MRLNYYHVQQDQIQKAIEEGNKSQKMIKIIKTSKQRELKRKRDKNRKRNNKRENKTKIKKTLLYKQKEMKEQQKEKKKIL